MTAPYDRAALTAGIVHIGVGHFHRSHQAMYLHRLIALGSSNEWAIWGVTMGNKNSDVLEDFRAQDCLYSLTEKASDGARTSTVIGSIIGIESASSDHDSVVARMADPATRIISLTITEGGYGIDPATGQFGGAGDSRIEADLAAVESSQSWLGLIIHALRARSDADAGPITVMSCDNIPENGVVTRRALRGFAERVAPELLPWIDANVSFPSSMVDRVTPDTTDEDRDYLARAFGIEDTWAVICEPFSQWAVEDHFANGRPNFEAVGVEVVDDVHPYERMKLRLANGTHQALCFFGTLLGHSYVHEAIADSDLNSMLIRYIDDEAVPTLSPIAGVDISLWGHAVLGRFGNPQMEDPLTRICAETSDRIPKFLLPVIRDELRAEGSIEVCAAVVASWARYALGIDERGKPLDVSDTRRRAVMKAARADVERPGAFLQLNDVFGDLASEERFVVAYKNAVQMLRLSGARELVRSLHFNVTGAS